MPPAAPAIDFAARAATLLDPRHPTLRRLARRRPRRVYADVARCYALIAAALLLVQRFDGWWMAAVAVLLIGTQQYALAVIEHDGKHGNLLPDRAANDRFTIWLLCAPLGLDPHFSRKVADHHGHHRLLGTEPDPERRLYTAEDKAQARDWLFYLSGLSTLPKALRTSLRYGIAGAQTPPTRRQRDAWWPTVAVQVALCLGFALWSTWWHYVVFWLAPIYPLVFVTRKIRAFCEHAHPVVPDAAADAARLVTYVPSGVERAVLAPMMMNYHGEHHLWPFVPYYNLPALHRLVGPTPLIEVRRSYLGFLWRYFRALPLARPSCALPVPPRVVSPFGVP